MCASSAGKPVERDILLIRSIIAVLMFRISSSVSVWEAARPAVVASRAATRRISVSCSICVCGLKPPTNGRGNVEEKIDDDDQPGGDRDWPFRPSDQPVGFLALSLRHGVDPPGGQGSWVCVVMAGAPSWRGWWALGGKAPGSMILVGLGGRHR